MHYEFHLGQCPRIIMAMFLFPSCFKELNTMEGIRIPRPVDTENKVFSYVVVFLWYHMNPNWLPVQIITPYLKIAKFGAIRLGFLLTLELLSLLQHQSSTYVKPCYLVFISSIVPLHLNPKNG